MSKNQITFNELMTELDKHRQPTGLTEEQIKFLKSARDEKKGIVPYPKIRELWIQKGWDAIALTTLRNRCVEIIKNGGGN